MIKELPISIIVPTFNQKEFLVKALRSLRYQELRVEIIVVDGCSTDGTKELLKNNPDLYDVFVSEKDSGQSEAINKGLRLAHGVYFSWLNSDDQYYPDVLSGVWDDIVNNDYPDLFACGGRKVSIDGEILKEVLPNSDMAKTIKRSMCVIQPSVFFQRSLIERVGFPCEDLHYVMDWEYINRILAEKGATFQFSEKIVSNLLIHRQTKTATGGWQRAEEIAAVGYRLNSWSDYNFIMFTMKSFLWRIQIPLVAPLLRYLSEYISDFFLKRRLTMIRGWPERPKSD
nr:glycosyltransferase [Gammaproteobacteria bacterium]